MPGVPLVTLPRRHGVRAARGVTIVEILVALVLGLLLINGITSVLLGSRKTSQAERNLLEMQSTGRVAIDLLLREVRKAGFRSNRVGSLADVFPVAVSPFTTAGAVVRGATTGSGISLRLQGSGDTWTADCLGNAVGDAQDLWQDLWLEDGELFCRARNLSTGADQTMSLIPQIEALDITYGIDNNNDGFADVYQAVGAVTDWSRVVSVNLQLRVLSAEDGVADAPQAYVGFDGTVVTPTDRRLRRTYAAVAALRNILP